MSNLFRLLCACHIGFVFINSFEKMEFLVKTKIRDVYKFVKIKENDFSVFDFIQTGKKFQI